MSGLRLRNSYTRERLEGACALALTKFRSPGYRHLNSILAANEDVIYLNSQKKTIEEKNTAGYVRGAAYYGGHHNDQ